MTQSSVKQHNIGFLLVRTHFKTHMAEYKIEYYVLSEYGSDSVKKYNTMDLSIKLVKFGFNYHKKKLPGRRFIGLIPFDWLVILKEEVWSCDGVKQITLTTLTLCTNQYSNV